MMKKIIWVPVILLVGGVVFWMYQTSGDDASASAPENSGRSSDKEKVEIVMNRGEYCQCCVKWADYLEENGFRVIDRTVNNLLDIKSDNHVSSDLVSCHTAKIDGYVVEGHVPSNEIRRLISEQPDAAGIAVSGMPMGSPGMDSFRSDPYDVILFDENGNQSVFARY